MISWCIALLVIVQAGGAVEGVSALTTGDQAFLHLDYPTAVSSYESMLRAAPADAGILWRLARVYVCMGEVAAGDERESCLKRAEGYARRCVAADSSNGQGHTWLAGALGFLALDAAVSDKIAISHEMMKELDRALAINPDDDAALSIRGSFYRALGNVGWLQRELAALFIGRVPSGGYKESEEALLHAVAVAPNVMRHHYELAVLYIDWGRKEEARAVLMRAATLPVQIAGDRPRRERIEEFVKALSHSED